MAKYVDGNGLKRFHSKMAEIYPTATEVDEAIDLAVAAGTTKIQTTGVGVVVSDASGNMTSTKTLPMGVTMVSGVVNGGTISGNVTIQPAAYFNGASQSTSATGRLLILPSSTSGSAYVASYLPTSMLTGSISGAMVYGVRGSTIVDGAYITGLSASNIVTGSLSASLLTGSISASLLSGHLSPYAKTADLSAYGKKISVDTTYQSTTSTGSGVTIYPNSFYKFGTMTTLTLLLGSPSDSTIYNEYMFEFVSGSTATSLSLPSSVIWANGEVPVIEANKTYHVSIVNNLATIVGFPNA